jgi:hypothetical protein
LFVQLIAILLLMLITFYILIIIYLCIGSLPGYAY